MSCFCYNKLCVKKEKKKKKKKKSTYLINYFFNIFAKKIPISFASHCITIVTIVWSVIWWLVENEGRTSGESQWHWLLTIHNLFLFFFNETIAFQLIE